MQYKPGVPETPKNSGEIEDIHSRMMRLLIAEKNRGPLWVEGKTTFVVGRGSRDRQEWFLTNRSFEADNPDEENSRELYALDIECTPQSLLMAIGVICSKLWVDKAKFLEAMMPAINSVTWDRELMAIPPNRPMLDS